jgi:hypothetical protein
VLELSRIARGFVTGQQIGSALGLRHEEHSSPAAASAALRAGGLQITVVHALRLLAPSGVRFRHGERRVLARSRPKFVIGPSPSYASTSARKIFWRRAVKPAGGGTPAIADADGTQLPAAESKEQRETGQRGATGYDLFQSHSSFTDTPSTHP